MSQGVGERTILSVEGHRGGAGGASHPEEAGSVKLPPSIERMPICDLS
jgi:hypothetical protein